MDSFSFRPPTLLTSDMAFKIGEAAGYTQRSLGS